MVVAGAILSAIVGALACSGPYLWVAMQNPEAEDWGFDAGLTATMLVTGAIIGGFCAVRLAQMGGRAGKAVNIERGETVGVVLGILAGEVIGGLVAFSLAILGMGILA